MKPLYSTIAADLLRVTGSVDDVGGCGRMVEVWVTRALWIGTTVRLRFMLLGPLLSCYGHLADTIHRFPLHLDSVCRDWLHDARESIVHDPRKGVSGLPL